MTNHQVHGQRVEQRLLEYGARVKQQQELKLKEREEGKKKTGRWDASDRSLAETVDDGQQHEEG